MKLKHLVATIFILCSAASAGAQTQYLTTENFLKKVADYKANPTTWNYLGDKPCIIDFYTTWCGPCKRLAPIMEELAQEYKGKIYIYRVDTERERELAAAFGISSIPTLLFCPMNEAPRIAQGLQPKEQLVEWINTILLKQP